MANPNDLSRITDGLAKLESSRSGYTGSKKKAARALARHSITLVKPAADAMAGDATAYTAAHQFYCEKPIKVLGVTVCPQATTAADNTDYVTISVVKGDGAGGAATTIASADTRAASLNALAAGVKETLTLSTTEADLRVAAGGVLGFALAKAGAGKIIGACSFTIHYEEEGADGYEVL